MTSDYSQGKIWDGFAKIAQGTGAGPTASEWDQLLEELQDCFPVTFESTTLIDEIRTLTFPGVPGFGLTTQGLAQWNKTTIDLTGVVVNMTDAGGSGNHGTVEIFDFPVGAILLGVVKANVGYTRGIGGIDDDATVRVGLGSESIGTNNQFLTDDEDEILEDNGGEDLVLGVGLYKASNGLIFGDNSLGDLDLNLNFVVPNPDSAADDIFTLSGDVTLIWTGLA